MHLICVIIPVLVIFIISYEHLDNETINDWWFKQDFVKI